MFLSEDEAKLKSVLSEVNEDEAKYIITDYIKSNNLHLKYITEITELSKDYMEKSNKFIENFKRDVNALYVDKQFDFNVMKNVDINEKNWFWYARLLRDTEDEVFPKNNYFEPTYLLKRLKPILSEISNFDNYANDKELYTLYNLCIQLMDKYLKEDNK